MVVFESDMNRIMPRKSAKYRPLGVANYTKASCCKNRPCLVTKYKSNQAERCGPGLRYKNLDGRIFLENLGLLFPR